MRVERSILEFKGFCNSKELADIVDTLDNYTLQNVHTIRISIVHCAKRVLKEYKPLLLKMDTDM